jgi:hypothetical protein
VIIQPQVNRTVRRGEDIDSRCLISSWLALALSLNSAPRSEVRRAGMRLGAIAAGLAADFRRLYRPQRARGDVQVIDADTEF